MDERDWNTSRKIKMKPRSLGVSNPTKKKKPSNDQILVPEEWLKSLLELATKSAGLSDKWMYEHENNNKIITQFSSLCGFALSAKHILEFNERLPERK